METSAAVNASAAKPRGGVPPDRLIARFGLMLAGSVCFWASFPPAEIAPAAWLAPLLWLFALDGTESARWRFRLGFFGAFGGVGASLYWLWALFGAGAIFLWGLLSIYFGLWAMSLGAARRLPRLAAILWPAVAWTALEYFRAEQAPMRFSWLSLGYSQQNALGQALSPVIGVYGVSFLLVAWAGAFAALWPGRLGPSKTRFGLWALALAPALSLVPRPAWQGETLGTAWLQQVRDHDMAPTAPDVEGIAADLVVWPEYSLFDSPFTPATAWFLEEAKKAAAKSRRGALFGAQDFPEGGPKSKNDFFNTAFLLDPAGEVAGKAVKNQPVQLILDGRPAKDVVVMDLPGEGPPLRLGAGVCYDGSYQNFSRKMAMRGADILCFPTFNKADWGPVQHRQHQRMFQSRAMEHRLPVIVAANSGPTFAAWPGGEVAAEIPGAINKGLLAPIGRSPDGGPTLFARGGWLIAPGLQGLFALGLAFAWREKRRSPLEAPPRPT